MAFLSGRDAIYCMFYRTPRRQAFGSTLRLRPPENFVETLGYTLCLPLTSEIGPHLLYRPTPIREGDISLISHFYHLMCHFRQLYNLGQNYIFFQGFEWQGPVINKTE